MGTIVEAAAPFDTEKLDQFAGKWVALRGGDQIVAVADTVEELLQIPEVVPNDGLYRVPERGAVFY